MLMTLYLYKDHETSALSTVSRFPFNMLPIAFITLQGVCNDYSR